MKKYLPIFAVLPLTLLAAATTTQYIVRSGNTWAPTETINAPGVNGAAILQGDVRNARIGPAVVTNAYRAVETRQGTILRNITIDGLTATGLQRDGVRLEGDIDGVTISRFNFQMRAEQQVRPHLPEGIAIYSGNNVTIRNGTANGFRLAFVKGLYTNGDGVAAEGRVNSLRIEQVEANDNGDAGFDLKSKNTYLNNLIARRNYRNYRIWYHANAGTLTSIEPYNASGAHLWIGEGAVVKISKLIARATTSTAPVIHIEGAKSVEIGSCDIRVPSAARYLIASPSTILKLGPGCRRS